MEQRVKAPTVPARFVRSRAHRNAASTFDGVAAGLAR
jgi:hypothetical protein